MEFKRTICFVKTKQRDGTYRLRRIPWDLIATDAKHCEFMAAPSPVNIFDLNGDNSIQPIDMMTEDKSYMKINDEVERIEYFGSENEFYAIFECVFGYYIDGDKVSSQFGYPRS